MQLSKYGRRGELLLAIIGLCTLLSCCHGTSTVWSVESKSPNGIFLAEARTATVGGFGTAAAPVTSVYLKFSKASWPPFLILAFANPTARPIGVTAVKLKWVTNSHLDVAYSKPATLTFQAVQAAGVKITVHQVGQ